MMNHHYYILYIYGVYLANIEFGDFEHKCKLADIYFGEQDDIDVDCFIL